MVKKCLIKNVSSNSIMSNPLVIIIVIILSLIVILSIFRPATPYLTFGLGFNTHIGDLKSSFQLEAFKNKPKIYYIIFPKNFDKNLPVYKLLNNKPIRISFFNDYNDIVSGIEEERITYKDKIDHITYKDKIDHITYKDKIDHIDLPILRNNITLDLFSYTPQNGYKTYLYIDKKYIDYADSTTALNKTTDIPLLIWNGKNKIKVADVTFKEIYYESNQT